MKQLHIIQHLKPGGIESLVSEIMRLQNSEVHIVMLEGKSSHSLGVMPHLKAFEHRLHFLDKGAGFSMSTLFKLRKIIEKIDPVFVNSHHIGPLIYTSLACLMTKRVHVHTEHDAWHLDADWHRKLQSAALTIGSPIWVADAHFVQKKLQEHFPDGKTRVIHNGIDIERFQPADQSHARAFLELPNEVPMIGCAARLEPVKNLQQLIKILVHLPDVHLAIAGTGSLKDQLFVQARELKVSQRVHFLGQVQKVERFYQALDLFCLVSENEGFPLSVLEAQACNIPVIVRDVGGCRESICQKTGMVLQTKSDIELINAIKVQLARSFKIKPRNFIEQRFSVQQMMSAYQQLVEIKYQGVA